MAIWGTIDMVERQLRGGDRWAGVFAYLRAAARSGSEVHQRILALAPGVTERVELERGAFALEQAYTVKPPAAGRLEAHERYVDLQLLVAGLEGMEVTTVAGLTVTEDAIGERDVRFFADASPVSCWCVRPGEVAVFYPADAHKPSLEPAPGDSRVNYKTVVKVPVDA